MAMPKAVKWWHLFLVGIVCLLMLLAILLFEPIDTNVPPQEDATKIPAYIDVVTEDDILQEEVVYFYDTFRDYVYRCYIRSDGNIQMILDSDGNPSIAGFIEKEEKEVTTTE